MAASTAPKTFVSYSRVNQQFTIRLVSELKSAGFSIWMDQFDIPTGARWDDEIERALKACPIFLFIISPASVASENAKDEMGYAIDHGKYILPVLLEKCEVPLRLRRMQYVDFTQLSFEDGLQRVKELLSRLIGEIEAKEAAGPSAMADTKTVPTGTVSHPPRWKGPSGRKKTGYALGGVVLFVVALLTATLLLRSNPSSFLSPALQAFTTTSSPTLLAPTDTVIPSDTPTISSPEKPRSFLEDFDSDISWNSDWTLLFRHGNDRKQKSFHSTLADGELAFKLDYEYIWAYFLFNQILDYQNVELEAVVSNLRSTGTIGMICQYGDQGWYEFDINGGGKFDLRYVDSMNSNEDNPRYLIRSGSIPNFHFSDQAIIKENTINVRCNGNSLSLAVNGKEWLKDYIVGSYLPVLTQGQVGIAARTEKLYPADFVLKSLSVTEK